MARAFKTSDEGKRVMTADGKEVGIVEEIKDKKAYIKPDANLGKSVRRKLGWTKEGEATYELKHNSVKKFSSDEIQLKRNL